MTMPAPDNTITQNEVLRAADVEFSVNFKNQLVQLQTALGITGVETVTAGTTLYQRKITGTLEESTPEEGDLVKYSKYQYEETPIGKLKIERYAKLTTAEAIQKAGADAAIDRTDAKMMGDLYAKVWKDFFTFLNTGTGTATGEGLQAAIAMARAELSKSLEKNNDILSGSVVWFMNPEDTAKYLAQAPVTMQTVFGLNYLQSFLGVSNVFETTAVEAGNLICTPAENLHLFTIDFGALAGAGLTYENLDYGMFGVKHEPVTDRGAIATHVMTAVDLVAEVKDYIVKATITDPSEAV